MGDRLSGFGCDGFRRIVTNGAGNVPVAWAGRAVALFALGLEFLEVVDFAEATEELLAEIGVDAGFLGSDAVADAIESDGFEEAVDVFSGGESAGGLREFCRGELGGRGLVRAAEAGIGSANGLGALASGGGAMLAAGKSEFGFGLKEIEFHLGTPWGYPPVFA